MIASTRHVHVLGALGRLAATGGWARVMDGKPLEAALDLVDAELLVAAGVLEVGRVGDGTFVPTDLHACYADPTALADAVTCELQQALRQVRGTDEVGRDEIRARGSASAAAATALVEGVVPMLASAHGALVGGRGEFLDVGVGAGVVSATLCRTWPGARAVGIDVLPEALALARDEAARCAVAERVELRLQSVADLDDVDRFDLAWLPQVFVPRVDLDRGIAAVHRALRPGGWLVMPVASVSDDDSELDRAAVRHDAALKGGGLVDDADVRGVLAGVGFTVERTLCGVDQTVFLARRPG
ncbi:MAG: hypothetical protein JWN84_2331 [Nocardioides sp.]|nr:hypothetical protein [Nocardioides sp.]